MPAGEGGGRPCGHRSTTSLTERTRALTTLAKQTEKQDWKQRTSWLLSRFPQLEPASECCCATPSPPHTHARMCARTNAHSYACTLSHARSLVCARFSVLICCFGSFIFASRTGGFHSDACWHTGIPKCLTCKRGYAMQRRRSLALVHTHSRAFSCSSQQTSSSP